MSSIFFLEHEIVVATTRPETLYGDVAIAVHPDDERYAKYIGQQVWHTLRETYIPVICDSLVDRNFGTGHFLYQFSSIISCPIIYYNETEFFF